MKKLLLIAALAFSLVACSNPKELVIPNESKDWSPKLKAAVDKLPKEEQGLLMGYYLRAKIQQATDGGKGVPEGMTVGRAIEDQRTWLKENANK